MPTEHHPDPGDLPLYGLDIETDTTVDGLDPAVAAVVAVALSGPGVEEVLTGPEPELLVALDRLLADLPAGVLVTWNGSGFDLPFLAERSRRLATPLALSVHERPQRPPRPARRAPATAAGPGAGADGVDAAEPAGPAERLPRVRATWHHHRHLDGYRLYRADVGRGLGLSCGLKPLARLTGLPLVEVDRDRMHELDAEQMRAYVLSDARLARQLVLRRWPAAAAWVDCVPGDAAVPLAAPDGAADRVAVPGRGPARAVHAVTP